MPRLTRRAVLAAACGAMPGLARAQGAWPDRPVTLLVPWAPGGSNDIAARLLAAPLEGRFGHPFVVENRPGGGGSLGMGLVARARPDGQTLLVSSASNHVFHPLVSGDLGYDVRTAFDAIAMLVDVPNVIVAHPALGVANIPDLIARVRRMRGGISFGSSGVGSSNHLAGELLRLRTGLEMTHVPYRGGGHALTDILSGTIQLAFMNLPTVTQAAADGRLRILAVCTEARVPSRTDLPTVQEQGVADYAVRSWTGLFAPRGTPKPVIDRLSPAMREVMETPAVRQRLLDMGSEPIWMGPEDTARFVAAEYDRWTPVVRAAGITKDS